MQNLESLREHPALVHLNATQVENLASISQLDDRPIGYEIITRHQEGECLYFLLEGRLDVRFSDNPSEQTRIEVAAPAVVGEMEFLTGQARTATVSCATKATLLAVPYDVLRERIDDGDPAALKLMAHIARVLALRLTRMTEKFAEIDATAPPARRKELLEFRKTLFTDWTV